MRRVVIHLSHGFAVRNFIYSDLAKELARSFRLCFLVPAELPASARQALEKLGEVAVFAPRRHPLESRLSFVRRYVLANPKRAQTISLFSMSFSEKRPIASRALRIANAVLGRSRLLRNLWIALEHRLTAAPEVDALFRDLAPAGVLASNYGTEHEAIQLFIAARKHGVPTLSVVPSWDNLSSKGVMSAQPDKLIVWNEIMRREAIEMHDFAPSDVEICGPLQFDIYARAPDRPRTEVCRELGLDPARPYIVYGTITPRYFPHNWQIIRQLGASISSGLLDQNLQVLVRIHPQVVDDPVFGERIETYRELAAEYPSIINNIPRIEDWGKIKPVDPADPELLVHMLRHAAAAIVPGSTLAIDAAAAGCPVIGLAYDGDEERVYGSSIRRWYDYTYFLPLMETGGLPLAHSCDELIKEIGACLNDRNRLLGERKAIVAQQIGELDGEAHLRIARSAARLFGASVPADHAPSRAKIAAV